MVYYCSAIIANAQYFQHVYYSTPKNENEWLNHGLRDTIVSDSALQDDKRCYAATGIFDDKIGTGSPNVNRVKYLVANKWGTPLTNVYHKVYSSNGNSEYDAYGNFMEKTPDGHIIVGKVTSSTGDSIAINGQSDLLILRVTNNGNVTYAKRVDMGYAEEGMCIQQLNSSSDYIICGIRRRASGSEAIVMRFTLGGNIVWCEAFNFNASYTNYFATANHLVIDANDNAYMVGSYRYKDGEQNVLVFGVDRNGALLELGMIGDAAHDEIGNSIRRTQNAGEYAIVGEVHEAGKKRADGLVFHFTPASATINNYKYIHSWNVNPTSYAGLIFEDIQERINPLTSDQTFYATGAVTNAANGNNDAVVFQLDPLLDPIGEYHYGGQQHDFSKAIDLVNYDAVGDGFVFFGGYGNTSPANTYSYITKAYFNGVTACIDTIQDSLKTDIDPQYHELDTVIFDNDTLINLYAVKYQSADSVICQDTVISDSLSKRINSFENNIVEVSVWPNPIITGNSVNFEYIAETNTDIHIYILDVSGRVLVSSVIKVNKGYNLLQTVVFDTLPPGSYFIQINDQGKGSVFRVVK